jgi:hypothetical protein
MAYPMRTILHKLPAAYRLWRRTRGSSPARWLRLALPDPRHVVTHRRLERHARAAAAVGDPSHAGEWPYLAGLLERLGLLDGGFALDLAAGDGVTGSCTLPLFRDRGWAGLAFECDPVRFRLLAHAYRGFPRVRLAGVRVTPADVVRLLRLYGAPTEPTLLNLDLDSFDLQVAGALLSGFRPLVVDMEINEKVPPPLRFALRYSDGHRWDGGHCYGCSIDAAYDVLTAADYVLEGLEYNNAFFVRGDAARAAGIGGVTAPTPITPATSTGPTGTCSSPGTTTWSGCRRSGPRRRWRSCAGASPATRGASCCGWRRSRPAGSWTMKGPGAPVAEARA